jgi:hypothetical protein
MLVAAPRTFHRGQSPRQNIAHNLPSTGIEVGQNDAKEGWTTPTTQITDETITCGPSMK